MTTIHGLKDGTHASKPVTTQGYITVGGFRNIIAETRGAIDGTEEYLSRIVSKFLLRMFDVDISARINGRTATPILKSTVEDIMNVCNANMYNERNLDAVDHTIFVAADYYFRRVSKRPNTHEFRDFLAQRWLTPGISVDYLSMVLVLANPVGKVSVYAGKFIYDVIEPYDNMVAHIMTQFFDSTAYLSMHSIDTNIVKKKKATIQAKAALRDKSAEHFVGNAYGLPFYALVHTFTDMEQFKTEFGVFFQAENIIASTREDLLNALFELYHRTQKKYSPSDMPKDYGFRFLCVIFSMEAGRYAFLPHGARPNMGWYLQAGRTDTKSLENHFLSEVGSGRKQIIKELHLQTILPDDSIVIGTKDEVDAYWRFLAMQYIVFARKKFKGV